MSVALRRLRGNNKKLVNYGALHLSLATGFVAYWNYRIKIKKEFLLSAGQYRFGQPMTNMTPWEATFLTWYRMPPMEYIMHHRFRPYFVIGQIDYTKEILLPKTRHINGKKLAGYDVINPLYCYDGGKIHLESIAKGEDDSNKLIRPEKAALILHRGWIPYHMKNKKTRPWETNSHQLVKVNGVFRPSPDIHEYKKPNNPTNNEWYNLALEDIARFWELPNANEMKFYYFQQVDVHNEGGSTVNNSKVLYKWPYLLNKDDTIRDHYNWWCHEKWNKYIYYGLTPVSVASFVIFYLTF